MLRFYAVIHYGYGQDFRFHVAWAESNQQAATQALKALKHPVTQA
jgi:hypothetical protein